MIRRMLSLALLLAALPAFAQVKSYNADQYRTAVQSATPATPSAGGVIYHKSDGLHFLNAAGSDVNLSLGGSAVSSVTGTAPIVSSGGTTPAISIPQATSSASGYLSSSDWTLFNGKPSDAPSDGIAYARKNGAWTPSASTIPVMSVSASATLPESSMGKLVTVSPDGAGITLTLPTPSYSSAGYLPIYIRNGSLGDVAIRSAIGLVKTLRPYSLAAFLYDGSYWVCVQDVSRMTYWDGGNWNDNNVAPSEEKVQQALQLSVAMAANLLDNSTCDLSLAISGASLQATRANGNRVALYESSEALIVWPLYRIDADLSLALSGLTASTVYDVYIYYAPETSVLTLSLSPRSGSPTYEVSDGVKTLAGSPRYRWLGAIQATAANAATIVERAGVGSAASRDVGSVAGSVAAGDHLHSGVYEAANANIQTHIASTSNPHGVTKAQVGLGNVPNIDASNAANITSGTLPDARLSSAIPRMLTADATVNITFGSTASTIQGLIDAQPKNLNGKTLTFQFASPPVGSFSGSATIVGDGSTAVATLASHGFTVGDLVYIDGTTNFDTPASGGYSITAATTNTFSFAHAYSGTETPPATAIARKAYNLTAALVFSGFSNGALQIFGNTTETNASSNHKTQSVVIQNNSNIALDVESCTAAVLIFNLRIAQVGASNSFGIFSKNCPGGVTCYYDAVSSVNAAGGFPYYFTGETCYVYNSMLSGGNRGLQMSQCMGKAYGVSTWGTLPAYGVVSDAAFVCVGGTQPSGSTQAQLKANGGQIFN